MNTTKNNKLNSILISLGAPLIGILAGLLGGALLILFVGANPFETYQALFEGAFGGARQLTETALRATPLLLMALGLTVSFKARIWNVGGEGQYFIGALCGGSVALLAPELPRPVLLTSMLIAGMLGGAAWALVAALLKTRLNVNEIISTLMLNYVAGFLLVYLARGPLNDPLSTLPESAQLSAAAQLPILFGRRIHLGVGIAIALVPIIFFIFKSTLLGHRVRAVGSSSTVSRFIGLDVERIILFVLAFSGALAGLTGIIEVSARFTRLRPGISGGFGFSGMLVALLGRLHPVGVAFAAVFFAALEIGATSMHVVTGLPPDLANAIQAVIVLSVLATDAIIRRRFG